MRGIEPLAKRLRAVEQQSNQDVEIEIDFCDRASALARELTGMPSDEPSEVELLWPNEKPANDSEKLKTLMQHSPTQLTEIENEWEASSGPRARAALAELKRLKPLIAGDQSYLAAGVQ